MKYKTIKEFLTESPLMNSYFSMDRMSQLMTPIMKFISDNHPASTVIDNGNSYHHLKSDLGADIYYHHENGHPKEVSIIKDNIQVGVDKNDGDVNHIHNLMKHHIDKHGILNSDTSNTFGSKNLWINFIKKNPDLKFNYTNSKTNKQVSINKDTIDSESDNIWGRRSDFADIHLVATK